MAIRLGHDGDDFAETHEINVTPFIDVILVLLIIFMIAAPLATVDVLNEPTLISRRVGCVVLRPALDLTAVCLK